jgi:hypothetical protein
MHPRTLIVAVAALATGAMTALPAAAETEPTQLPLRAQIMFNLIDTNGDGFIDEAEAAALQRAIFAAIDTDGDGKLSSEEFAAVQMGPRGGHRQMMGRMMQQPDGERWFQRGPRGGQERQGRHGRMQRQDFQPGQGFGPGGPSGPDNAAMPMPGTGQGFGGPGGFALLASDFASLDADGDGVISIDEFTVAVPGGPSDVR